MATGQIVQPAVKPKPGEFPGQATLEKDSEKEVTQMSATYTTNARSNARLVRTIYDLFNQDKLEEAIAYATDDVAVSLYALGQEFTGREGFTAFMKGFKQAFPDLKIEVAYPGLRVRCGCIKPGSVESGQYYSGRTYYLLLE